MLHHLALTASDLPKSKRFYVFVLGCLGYEVTHSRDDLVVWGGGTPEILLYAARGDQAANTHRTYDPGFHHAAFEVQSREAVIEISEVVNAGGGVVLEGPQPYPNYSPTYFAVYFLDPDGLKLEVMCEAEEIS